MDDEEEIDSHFGTPYNNMVKQPTRVSRIAAASGIPTGHKKIKSNAKEVEMVAKNDEKLIYDLVGFDSSKRDI